MVPAALGGWTTLSFDPWAHPVLWLPLAVVVDVAMLDFGLYWAHRILHRPWLYRRVHLVHHRFRAPFLFTYTAVHPAEQLLYTLVVLVPLVTVPQHAGSYLIALAYTWWKVPEMGIAAAGWGWIISQSIGTVYTFLVEGWHWLRNGRQIAVPPTPTPEPEVSA